MTLIVNLFAGPGAGKSTTAAGLFQKLKRNGITCELVTEFAKDITWENRTHALQCQPYIFGKQLKNLTRVIGQVDVAITDSPILLSYVYGKAWPQSFRDGVVDIFQQMNNLNYFISRDKPYVQIGRKQTETEARGLDLTIKELLDTKNVNYTTIEFGSIVEQYENNLNRIERDVRSRLTAVVTI